MAEYVDGKEVKESLLEKLNDTIEKNTEITSKQNTILVKYTRRILWLTVAILLIALVQLVTIFVK